MHVILRKSRYISLCTSKRRYRLMINSLQTYIISIYPAF